MFRDLSLALAATFLILLAGCGQEPSPDLAAPPEEIAREVPVQATAAEASLPTDTANPSSVATQISPPFVSPVAEPNWWDDAIFYEVFVRSFADIDGDGVGDLNGLIENLDYLNDGDPNTDDDLGVSGIWLMPIMQSPSYHGYDVVDYYQIDDEYGSNEDFKRLIEEAHARGIHVIVDLVMNHTSDQHPWFQDARDPASDKRDWYVWSDEGGDHWHENDDGSFYYGNFWSGMPDLNFENPEVTAAMQEAIRFWLEDMGVDGFRLDAIKHLIEDGPILENTEATHTWLARDFYPYYKSINPQALTVGEAWSTTDDIAPYVGNEVDIAFEFSLAGAILQSVVSERKVNVERAMPVVSDAYPPGQYATFLANHDQNRTRSMLLSDEQAEVAATLQILLPGVPFIYYGEEIGMYGEKPDENIRRPMQWTAEGGFSTAEPWHPYFEDYPQRNVAGQNDDPDSLLNHYKDLIRLRNEFTTLRRGGWTMVETDHESVYAFLRSYGGDVVLVLVNLGRDPVEEYDLSLASGPLTETRVPALLMGVGDLRSPVINVAGGFEGYRPLAVLPPYSSTAINFEE